MTETRPQGLTTYELIEIFVKLIGDPNHNTAIMLWGLTGTGKSQIQRQIIETLARGAATWKPAKGVTPTGALDVVGDWGLVDLRTSLLEPTDLRGLPDLKGNTVRWVAPDELPIVGQEHRFPEKGMLFLDELTHSQPAMQSACFSMVLDHRCGPHILLPGWKIVAASNYASENANTYPLSGPLRSRFEHYHLRCSLDAFKQWSHVNSIDSRVTAFLNWNPDYLHKPTDNPEEAFPTPRTWANANRALSIFKNGHLEKVIAANVGPGAASMFHGFLDVFNKPELTVDIPSVLTGKTKSPKLSTQEPSIAWAFAACIAGHVKDKPELLSAAMEYFCSSAWKDALEIGRTGLADLKHVVGKERFAEKVAPLLGEIQKSYGKLL
jgi:hypothetical protein